MACARFAGVGVLLQSMTLALSLVLCGSCSVSPPPACVPSNFGVVRAETESIAKGVAELQNRFQPRIVSTVPDVENRLVEIWIQRTLRPSRFRHLDDDCLGFTSVDRDRVLVLVKYQDQHMPFVLAHELVHALLGETWVALSGPMQEGLCDVVAELIAPEAENPFAVMRLAECAALAGVMPFGYYYGIYRREEGSWETYDGPSGAVLFPPFDRPVDLDSLLEDRDVLVVESSGRAVGYFICRLIVENIGIRGLYELCAQQTAGQIPRRVLYEAAGLSADPNWQEVVKMFFDEERIRALAVQYPGYFAGVVLETLGQNEISGRGLKEVLRLARPRLVLHDGSEIQISELKEVCAQLNVLWPVASRSEPPHPGQR